MQFDVWGAVRTVVSFSSEEDGSALVSFIKTIGKAVCSLLVPSPLSCKGELLSSRESWEETITLCGTLASCLVEILPKVSEDVAACIVEQCRTWKRAVRSASVSLHSQQNAAPRTAGSDVRIVGDLCTLSCGLKGGLPLHMRVLASEAMHCIVLAFWGCKDILSEGTFPLRILRPLMACCSFPRLSRSCRFVAYEDLIHASYRRDAPKRFHRATRNCIFLSL